jgi:hypothetical protein
MRTKKITVGGVEYLVAKPTVGQLREYRERIDAAQKLEDKASAVFALEDSATNFVHGSLARAGYSGSAKDFLRDLEPEDLDAIFEELVRFSGSREKAEGEAVSP